MTVVFRMILDDPIGYRAILDVFGTEPRELIWLADGEGAMGLRGEVRQLTE